MQREDLEHKLNKLNEPYYNYLSHLPQETLRFIEAAGRIATGLHPIDGSYRLDLESEKEHDTKDGK